MFLRSRRLRKILRYLHPEVTYRLSHFLLKHLPGRIARVVKVDLELESRLLGVRLRNPVGVGAGIDKDGDLARFFLEIGCGFHVVGSILLRRRRGNPHPRLLRYPEVLAMMNAMGLPSRGILYVLQRLSRLSQDVVIIANIAGFSEQEFAVLAKLLDPVPCVKIIELNLSCPQYRGLDYHNPDVLRSIISEVRKYSSKPILVKIRPRIEYETLKNIVKICEEFSDVGLTISNSFSTRASCMSSGVGGFSGLPLYKLVKKLIHCVRRISDIDIVACGGVFSGWQVLELAKRYRVAAVQIVTAIAYEGPLALSRILAELKQICN